MPVTEFDPVIFKSEQRAGWDVISSGWARWRDRYEAAAEPADRFLFEAAGLRPGHRVLDVGCGTGDPALSAAHAVAPDGHVLGVDLSPEMVAAAARRRGPGNVSFAEGDAETLDLPAGSFDAVLSRWGLMFLVDRVRAFRGLRRLLVPGGVLAATVWGPPQANPMTSLGFRALTEGLELPAPDPRQPGPFSMADPGRVTAELTEAGFSEVTVAELPLTMRFTSPAEFVAYTRAVLPPSAAAAIPHGRQGQAWRRVHLAAERYRTADGQVALPGLTLCLRAVAPGPKADD